jgi:6-phosphogluconolactonase
MPDPLLKICQAGLFAETAAECIAAELEASLSKKHITTFVLTGGKTPVLVYEKLAGPLYRNRIDWRRVEFFWGDERHVPPESPESNYGMARTALLSKAPVSPGRIHRIAGELEKAESAAVRYEEEIRKILPGEAPCFDLVLLGMGEDGHTASLFPGTIWDEEKLVIANHVPRLRADRISMTPRLLNDARSIIFLVAGAAKSAALSRVLQEPGCELPAARIRPAHGNLTWIVDSDAASLIQESSFRIRSRESEEELKNKKIKNSSSRGDSA